MVLNRAYSLSCNTICKSIMRDMGWLLDLYNIAKLLGRTVSPVDEVVETVPAKGGCEKMEAKGFPIGG